MANRGLLRFGNAQYTAALAVSGAWQGTNRNKLYEALDWECLYHRRYNALFQIKAE